MGLRNFWREAGIAGSISSKSTVAALRDALTLRNLGGGGDGCNNRNEAFSQARRYYHHALFYGFLFCFSSTCNAAVYEHIFGWVSPYPFLSLPVLLGTAGGLGMIVGAAGLLYIKIAADPAPASKAVLDIDYAFLALVVAASVTGLLLLALRQTAAMSNLLAVHLGVIVAFFLLLPYSKFVHGMYRSAALLRHSIERLPRSNSPSAHGKGA